MFAKIAQDIKDVTGSIWTGDQCCTRYKTVCKRKKSACVQNSQSGNSPQLVEYEDELEKIRHLDDSLEPEVVRDSAGVVSQKTSSQPSPASSQSESTDNSSSLSGSCEQKDDDHQKKEKGKRESTSRAHHMKVFLDKIQEIEESKAERKAARQQERERRKLENTRRREEMHSEKMELLRAVLGLKTDKPCALPPPSAPKNTK